MVARMNISLLSARIAEFGSQSFRTGPVLGRSEQVLDTYRVDILGGRNARIGEPMSAWS